MQYAYIVFRCYLQLPEKPAELRIHTGDYHALNITLNANCWIFASTYAWSWAIQTSAGDEKNSHTPCKILQEVELLSFNRMLCLCISCQFWRSECDMTNCLDVWLIYPSSPHPLLHMLIHTSYPRWSQSTTSSSAAVLRQGEGFLSSKDMARLGWLATLTEHARTPRPAVKEVE